MSPSVTALRELVYVLFIVCLLYTVGLYGFVAAVLGASVREVRRRRAEAAAEDFEALRVSRFTIPVTIIAPAYNEEVVIVSAVRTLLAQDYPALEVIVVNDGSTDGTMDLLIQSFALEPSARRSLADIPTEPIRRIYRSRTEPRLTVIDKENGRGKADALNCGVNYARYRYLCCVDGDTSYVPQAVLRAMRPAMHDAGSVVGVSSAFLVSRRPESESASLHRPQGIDPQLLSSFQCIELLRSFLCNRSGWSRHGFMMCNPGGFAMWRRDAILKVGGFSRAFSCEDIEMTFRQHERLRRDGQSGEILTLPDIVATTEGPARIADLSKQRVRWQRVVAETVWHYRKMLLRPRYGTVGLLGMPYFVLYEALAPLFQALSLATLAVAIALHVLQWPDYIYFTGAIVFATAIPTSMALFLNDAGMRDYRLREILRLVLLGPLDFFLYRPVLLWAGVRGTWGFLRGEKAWNKLVRNPRGSPV